jgi:hypothetical protein
MSEYSHHHPAKGLETRKDRCEKRKKGSQDDAVQTAEENS